jgi:sRNA-binding protein
MMNYEKLDNDWDTDVPDWDTERLAPEPKKKGSRAFKLYDVVRSIGDPATLNDIWKLIPASDLSKPRNKQELRDWVSSSGVSKGYIHKMAPDVYRIATLQEYEGIVARNTETASKYRTKVKAKELRAARKEAKREAKEQATRNATPVGVESVMPPRAPTPTKPVSKPVVKQPEPKQPEPSTSFANQYLGSLLGTSVAIILFYVIVRVI